MFQHVYITVASAYFKTISEDFGEVEFMLDTNKYEGGVKVSRQDFEEVRAIFRDQILDQGADVGPEEKCSDLMILFQWQIARINRKQKRAQNVIEKTNK